MNGNAKLYFIHIRKTAGTSMRSYLGQNYAAAKRFNIMSELELRGKFPDELQWISLFNEVEFISGHYYRLWPILQPLGYVAVTLLRDPLDRAISAYNQIQNDTRDPYHALCAGKTFVQAVQDPRLAVEFRNAQGRYLVLNNGGDYDKLANREKIAAAADFLSQIKVFAIQEMLVHGINVINRELFPAPPKLALQRLNIRTIASNLKRSDLDVDAITIFERHNTIDREIYTKALSIYDRRFG